MTPDVEETDVLYNLLRTILDTIVDTYQRAGVDLPPRRYVYVGPVAADCEQLTVSLEQHYKGLPGGNPNEMQKCNGPRTAVVTVQLFRATAGMNSRGQAPSVTDLENSSKIHLTDAWLLMSAVEAIDVLTLNTGVIADVTPVPASGNFLGVSMNLAMFVP